MLLPPEPARPDPSADADDPGCFALPPNCGTAAAEELRNRLALASAYGDATLIDGSDVTHVGQAVLQLLVAGKREADAQGRPFKIAPASSALMQIASACGLADAIGLPTGEMFA